MSNGVTATSYEALSLSYGIAMLSASATFTALATAQGLLPADIILESMGGVNPTTAEPLTTGTAISGNIIQIPRGIPPVIPYALVHQEMFPVEEIALHTPWGRRGDIEIGLMLPQVAGDAPYEVLRRVRNTAGGIIADINALWGQAGYLMAGSAELSRHAILDATTDLKGYCLAVIMMHWHSP